MNRFYVRRFLNSPGHHAGAYVLGEIEHTKPGEESLFAYSYLELADCSRRVRLDFPLTTAADRRNSLRKAHMLADVFTRYAEALEAEAVNVAENAKRRRRPARRHSADR